VLSRRLELYDEIINSKDIDSVQGVLSAQSRLLGFEKYAFFSFHMNAKPLSLHSRTLPLADYIQNRYFLCDPILNRAQHHLLPIIWETDKWVGKLNETQRNTLNALRDLEIERGVSIPVHGPYGHFNVLCLSTHTPMTDLSYWSFRYRDTLQLLGAYASSAIHEITSKKEKAVELTSRETECLYWTAEGKTAWEIAKILGIAERTVQFHIRNFMVKLDTCSKSQAVIKAISKGILRF